MKERAKCTYCMSQMANIYDTRKNPIVKDAEDMYIEVNSLNELLYIEAINEYMKRASLELKKLENYISTPH